MEISIKKAAIELAVNRSTIFRAIKRGQIKAQKSGRYSRVDMDSLLHFREHRPLLGGQAAKAARNRRDIITPPQAAKEIGVSKEGIYAAIRRGVLEAKRENGAFLIPIPAFEAFKSKYRRYGHAISGISQDERTISQAARLLKMSIAGVTAAIRRKDLKAREIDGHWVVKNEEIEKFSLNRPKTGAKTPWRTLEAGELTIAQAAKEIGISKVGIQKAIHRGDLKAERRPDGFIIKAENLDHFRQMRRGRGSALSPSTSRGDSYLRRAHERSAKISEGAK